MNDQGIRCRTIRQLISEHQSRGQYVPVEKHPLTAREREAHEALRVHGPQTKKWLAVFLGVSQSRVNILLEALMAKGFVRQQKAKNAASNPDLYYAARG